MRIWSTRDLPRVRVSIYDAVNTSPDGASAPPPSGEDLVYGGIASCGRNCACSLAFPQNHSCPHHATLPLTTTCCGMRSTLVADSPIRPLTRSSHFHDAMTRVAAQVAVRKSRPEFSNPRARRLARASAARTARSSASADERVAARMRPATEQHGKEKAFRHDHSIDRPATPRFAWPFRDGEARVDGAWPVPLLPRRRDIQSSEVM